eukprot:9163681-Pyramimonas_sp.AAC.1
MGKIRIAVTSKSDHTTSSFHGSSCADNSKGACTQQPRAVRVIIRGRTALRRPDARSPQPPAHHLRPPEVSGSDAICILVSPFLYSVSLPPPMLGLVRLSYFTL